MKITNNIFKKITKKYGTPVYLIDLTQAKKAFLKIRNYFPQNTKVAYATKANYSSSIIKLFDNLGLYFDVFTLGELNLLLSNKIDPKKIIFTGVSETKEEFDYVLSKGVRFFVIGSFNGFCNLKKVVEKEKIKADVLLRIQPIKRVVAECSVSGIKSKFGVLLDKGADSAKNILPKINGYLNFKGFHFHIGTQVTNPIFYLKAIDKTLEYVKKNKIKIEILDIGGGYPFPYTKDIPQIEKFGKEISKVINKWRKEIGQFELIIEPGRGLVADTTILITKVVNIKELYEKKIIIIDASNEMISVKRAEIQKSIKIIPQSKKMENYFIAGNLCHSKDWIVEKLELLPEVSVEDLVLFKNIGAYTISNNIPFGLRKKPKIIVVKALKTIEEKHPFDLMGK